MLLPVIKPLVVVVVFVKRVRRPALTPVPEVASPMRLVLLFLSSTISFGYCIVKNGNKPLKGEHCNLSNSAAEEPIQSILCAT